MMKSTVWLIVTLLLLVTLFSSTAGAQTNDLAPLFAPPTQNEIDAVLADWHGRDVQPYNWQTVGTGTMGNFTVDVVSHTVAGNTHYGFVRQPRNYDPTQTYPILILNHGGIGGVGMGIMGAYNNDCFSDYFLVVPSFRGETLYTESLGLGNLLSEGEVSEFDGDIDDVLALVNGTLAAYDGADEANMAVFGGSRGAGVSYLQSIRDPRIQRGVYFFGATDHMTYPGLQQTVETILATNQGQGPFYNTVVTVAEAYQAGNLTLAVARQQLLMRSAVHFIDRLPANIQIHHGALDLAVPVENGRLLDAALTTNNLPTGDYAYYEYPDGGHGNNMPNSAERRNTFLCTNTDRLYVSFDGAGTVGDVTYDPADVLRYTVATNGWELYFDASAEGIEGMADVTSIMFYNGRLAMTFAADTTVPYGFNGNPRTITPRDVVLWRPWDGVWFVGLSGETYGLTTAGEAIDAMTILPGVAAFSTTGTHATTAATPADLSRLRRSQTPPWSFYFDGSDVGLDTATENLNGLSGDLTTGYMYLTTAGAFDLGNGVTGDGRDVLGCQPTFGNMSACNAAVVWSGSTLGISDNVDGLIVIPAPP